MNRSRPFDSQSAETDVGQVVNHLFRREFGRLVAILVRRFGVQNLHLAEDVVQDALVRAMQTWPFTGVPCNPSAWLLQTARNRALDQTRRSRIWRGKQETLVPLVEDCLHAAMTAADPRFENEIRDSQLRMMFVCCHPDLPRESQVALTLKTLCGFGEREIAAGFLASVDAITKRLVRARRVLREQHISLELPDASELISRLDSVRQALYLLFNEGYKASHGNDLVRIDFCAEAIRLGELLVEHPVGRHPSTHALLALMHFNAARLPARTDEVGGILILGEQDRARWDHAHIRTGATHLDQSASGSEVTRYHLEAGIAACHVFAGNEAATDWAHILELYDALLAMHPSPIIALNRAVAVAHVHGPRVAIREIEKIEEREKLDDYHLLHAVLGHLWADAGESARAAEAYRLACELAVVDAERSFLARRLAAVESERESNR